MSRETILTAKDGTEYSLDNLSTQKWLEGHYSGLDRCCEWLEQRAMQLFSVRDHERALYVQKLSDEIKKELRPEMIERAREHEKEFPATLNAPERN